MLREWRKKAYFTQYSLADALGVNQSTVCGWEHGKSVPDVFTIEKLSKLLNVPVTSIIEYFKGFEKKEK